MGAILSGRTVCGLLIGASNAIGLKCGEGKEGIPEENVQERNRAIQVVGELYRDFTNEFGSTECRVLSNCDFANPEDVTNYIRDKGWKGTCDVFLEFVLRTCMKMSEENRV